MCAIAWTDDVKAVIISSTDPAGNVNYWWQAQGEQDWVPQLVGAPLFISGRYNSYQEPTMAWTGDAVIIAAADALGNLDYWWQAKEKTNWNLQHVAAAATDGGILYTGPAIAWAGNSVALVASDNSGDALTYWWQAKNKTPWNRQIVATAQQPAIACAGDDVVVTAVDTAGNLQYWWQSPEKTPFNPVQTVARSGRGITYAQPSIAWTGNAVVITAVDSNGNLYYWWQAKDGVDWNGQLVANTSTGVRYSRPSIAWTGSAVVITAVDSAGNLHYWWQPQGGAGWKAQLVASASANFVKYDFPAIAWADRAAVIAAKSFNTAGQLHQINYWWQPHGAPSWNAQTVATYAPIT